MAPKPKLLLIDDDDRFRADAETGLKADFEVFSAPDGEEGLRLALQKLPHAIVCDVIMPKLAGIEVVRKLQADLDARVIPVIVVSSSHANPATQGLFKQEPNFFAFLPKPCPIPDLKAKVLEAIASKA